MIHGMMPAQMPIDDGAPAVDVTGRRGDADEAGNHAVDRADDRRLAVGHRIQDRPHQQRHAGAQIGVDDRRGGIGVGKVGVAAVKAVPAEPQDAGAGQRHQQAIRREMVAILLDAGPDHRRRNKPRGAGGEMNHVTAGEVSGPQLGEPAATPNAERADRVDEGHPHRHEDHPRLKTHSSDQRTGEDDNSDRGKDELEEHHRRHRESPSGGMPDAAAGTVACWSMKPAESAGGRLAPERKPLLAERHVVSPQDPHDHHRGKGVHRHESRVDRPFPFYDSPIKNHQTGHALQADKRRGGHLPSVGAGIEPFWRWN